MFEPLKLIAMVLKFFRYVLVANSSIPRATLKVSLVSVLAFTHSHRQAFQQITLGAGRGILLCGNRQVGIESRLGAVFLAALMLPARCHLHCGGAQKSKGKQNFLVAFSINPFAQNLLLIQTLILRLGPCQTLSAPVSART